MPFGVDDAIAIGGAVYGAVKGRGSSRRDRRRAIAELRAARPLGYITPEDLRYAELLKGRLTEGVQNEGELAGYGIARRARARGLAGSPSEERDRARLEQQKLLGVQHAGEAGEKYLGDTRASRESFERDKALAIFDAEMGGAARDEARQAAEQGAFWNSLNEFATTILGNLDPKPLDALPGSGSRGGPGNQPGYRPGYRPEAVPAAL